MNKTIRYFLIAAATVIVLVAGVAAYIAATFDPNAYKPQAVAWVKEKTGRTLIVPGEVELSLFPRLGITVGKATLSERGSENVFASVDALHLALGVVPLLQRQVRIDDIRLQGLQIELVRDADGRLNIDDLTGTAGTATAGPDTTGTPAARKDFAVDSFSLANGTLKYRDEKTKSSFTVSDLSVKTGRIAPDQPGTIELSGRVQSAAPKLDLALQGKSGVAFAGDGKRIAVKDFTLDATGAALDVSGLAAKVRGG
ncbi:MAG: AsmA family protein, partial [Betaproteobacteria bacterium]|nr:AsmA family protein [Betaproteobacteria bacterium]